MCAASRSGRAPVAADPAIRVSSSLDQLPPAPVSGTPDQPERELSDRPVAIIVCHGMGQQVPFETLSSLADKLSNDNQQQNQRVGHVRFEDPVRPKRTLFLPRAEITVPDPDNPQEATRKRRKAHVYEVYWAPLTEGHIALTDVVRFLGVSGWQGLSFRTRTFLRWLFQQDRPFRIPGKTPLALLLALLLVLALVAINVVLTLVVGGNLFEEGKLADISSPLVDQLSRDLAGLLAVAVVAGGVLYLSDKLYRRRAVGRTPVATLALVLLILGAVVLVVVSGLMVAHYVDLRGKPAAAGASGQLSMGWVTVIWLLALIGSWLLRGFFVQYLGDVAIYIDADKVDKFHKVRLQIRELANRTACAIYAARQPGAPAAEAPFLYERVIVVGHSLGSLIAYDMLNAALVLDESLEGRLAVARRTRALVTFGSPLDKTAYIFHSKQPKNSLRAALRASAQPLTREIEVRQAISWANIYSRADFVSGRLEFYDYPMQDPANPDYWRICNLPDPDAGTPALAHNQYWQNDLLATTIAQAIFAGPTTIGWEWPKDTRPEMGARK